MLLKRMRRKLFGDYALLGRYKGHPGRAQERFSSASCASASSDGLVSEELLEEHMRRNHVRHDAFEVIERTPPLDQVLPKAA